VMLATDPGVTEDVPAWCRIQGHQVLMVEQSSEDRLIRIGIEVRGTPS
jgi:TusA-related sulfurtransferase